MDYVATITSKRQLTIPADLFKKAKLKSNQKLLIKLVKADSGLFTLEPMWRLVEDLAGSVPLASDYKGLSTKEIVDKARKDYYKKDI